MEGRERLEADLAVAPKMLKLLRHVKENGSGSQALIRHLQTEWPRGTSAAGHFEKALVHAISGRSVGELKQLQKNLSQVALALHGDIQRGLISVESEVFTRFSQLHELIGKEISNPPKNTVEAPPLLAVAQANVQRLVKEYGQKHKNFEQMLRLNVEQPVLQTLARLQPAQLQQVLSQAAEMCVGQEKHDAAEASIAGMLKVLKLNIPDQTGANRIPDDGHCLFHALRQAQRTADPDTYDEAHDKEPPGKPSLNAAHQVRKELAEKLEKIKTRNGLIAVLGHSDQIGVARSETLERLNGGIGKANASKDHWGDDSAMQLFAMSRDRTVVCVHGGGASIFRPHGVRVDLADAATVKNHIKAQGHPPLFIVHKGGSHFVDAHPVSKQ